MGININNLRFLLRAKRQGVDFSRTMMLGRQGLHLSYRQFAGVVREFGLPASAAELRRAYERRFAEGVFELLGARTVDSIDFSDFQAATHLADLNRPIPPELRGRYTAVVDGGTLEHVFNFPTAIANCMRMLAVGGHFIGFSVANNYLGHGFYQFSPELFHRVFSPPNGFSVLEMFIHEGRETGVWRRAMDSDVVRRRVTLRNARPTGLLILARKAADVAPFATVPLQSEYERIWTEGKDLPDYSKKLVRALPGFLRAAVMLVYEARLKARYFQREKPGAFTPERAGDAPGASARRAAEPGALPQVD